MYGWIQETIEALVLEKFGAETWEKIKADAGLTEIPNRGFARHEYYHDDVTFKLVSSASKELGLEPAVVLSVYGEFFITWMMKNGYGSMLKNQGTGMLDFLNAMDDLHRGLQTGLPLLVPPSLSCEGDEESSDLILLYVSSREGLAPMLCGLVKGVGREVFSNEYGCEIVEQWKTQGTKGQILHHTKYLIKCPESNSLPETSSPLSRRSVDTTNYSFFEQNAQMAGAWAQICARQVQALETEQQARAWAANFDLQQLTSLMSVYTPQAEFALSSLFRCPLQHSGHVIPVPEFGFISGPGGMRGLQTKMYPSMMMCSDVMFGPGALVSTQAARGKRQVPIQLLVCALPNPLADGWLLRALIDTPNHGILESLAARALLNSAWMLVRPRLLFDSALDSTVVALATWWSLVPSQQYVGWQFLAAVFSKELFEYALQIRAYLRRGWFSQCLAPYEWFTWACFVLYLCLLYSIGVHPDQGDKTSSRIPLAVFVCIRWWRALLNLRGFVMFGPKILPILYTLKSMGPFVFVVVMILLGLISAFFALDGQGITSDAFLLAYTLGFLGDTERTYAYSNASWLEMWFCIFVLVIAIVMVNILIGVISESYDMHQDNAAVIFGREQANIVLNIYLRLLPVKVFYSRLHWVQAIVSLEAIHDASPQYLWACRPNDMPPRAARLSDLKQHMSREADLIKTRTDQIAEGLNSMQHMSRLDDLCQRLQRIELHLQDQQGPSTPPTLCPHLLTSRMKSM